MKITTNDAILALIPGAEFRLVDNDLSSLEFFNPKDAKAPTQSEIDAKILELQAKADQDELQKQEAKKNLLERLGITEDEAKLLLS